MISLQVYDPHPIPKMYKNEILTSKKIYKAFYKYDLPYTISVYITYNHINTNYKFFYVQSIEKIA